MAEQNNYVVGRGKLYFERFADGTTQGSGFRYFGNTPELSTTQSMESLEHYNSDEGLKFKDLSVDLSNDMSGSFTCDNIDLDNVALFFLGEAATQVVTSDSAVAATGTLTLSGTGTDGDTVTINGQAITLQDASPTGFDVLIGGSATDTAQNIKAKINANPSTFGVTASGNAAVLTLTAITPGPTGNAITTTESGTATAFGAATLTGGTDAPTETLTGVQRGLYYPLGVSEEVPQGLRGISIVGVEVGGNPVLADGNWEFDTTTGLFHVLDDAADIADDDDVEISMTVAGGTQNLVIGGNKSIYGALRFYSRNPVGRQKDYFWPYVKLSANGDLNLKGDDWQTLGWNFEVLRLNDQTERVYVVDRAG